MSAWYNYVPPSLSSAKVRNLFHVAMDLEWADVKIC